jgi:hypothetical protein
MLAREALLVAAANENWIGKASQLVGELGRCFTREQEDQAHVQRKMVAAPRLTWARSTVPRHRIPVALNQEEKLT